jgi:chromosome segregation and condensation protein ScpB
MAVALIGFCSIRDAIPVGHQRPPRRAPAPFRNHPARRHHISELRVPLRLALRRLAAQLEPLGMHVLDDGSHVQLAPDERFRAAVAQLVQPEQLPRLTQEQAEVLAIVITDGMATRRLIEEVRGGTQLSIGPDGPVSLPLDSSETLVLLLSRGLLCADRDDHAKGRPLVYRPTPRLLQLIGAETLEEARRAMAVTAEHRSQGSQPQDQAAPFEHQADSQRAVTQ